MLNTIWSEFDGSPYQYYYIFLLFTPDKTILINCCNIHYKAGGKCDLNALEYIHTMRHPLDKRNSRIFLCKYCIKYLK